MERMGFLWDILQQSQISDTKSTVNHQQGQLAELHARVQRVEAELTQTRQVLGQLIKWLEKTHGCDIDGDGRIG